MKKRFLPVYTLPMEARNYDGTFSLSVDKRQIPSSNIGTRQNLGV